jgi:hypothetical protein
LATKQNPVTRKGRNRKARHVGNTPGIPSHKKRRQEDLQFQGSLGYIAKPCLKNKTKRKEGREGGREGGRGMTDASSLLTIKLFF